MKRWKKKWQKIQNTENRSSRLISLNHGISARHSTLRNHQQFIQHFGAGCRNTFYNFFASVDLKVNYVQLKVFNSSSSWISFVHKARTMTEAWSATISAFPEISSSSSFIPQWQWKSLKFHWPLYIVDCLVLCSWKKMEKSIP